MSSPIEVEKKAWVDDLDSLEDKVRKIGRLIKEIDYRDTYYTYKSVEGYTHERFRLRETGAKAWVTAKELIKGEGEEANIEHEFTVSDPASFHRFVTIFGFKVLVTKTKSGKIYQVDDESGGPPARIELVDIGGLGNFVEIEIMVPESAMIGDAKKRVNALFQKIGIGPEYVEDRPYTLMIYEKSGKED